MPKDQCKCEFSSCERHGNCEQCQAFHKANNSLTGCQREAAKAQASK